MATNDKICKVDVLNPLSMFNTVGKELEEIFLSRGITDASLRMGIKDLSGKEKLTDKQIEKAKDLLEMDDEFCKYLHKFQEDYQLEKEKCKASYKEAKKNFTRLKNILPLLRNEFNDGMDRLEDILDFFDADSEKEVFQSSETIAALFRQQNNVEVDPINLKAWLRRAELDYQQMVLPLYDENAFKQWIDSKEWENHIEDVDYFMGLPEKLAKFGVALIFVPFLKKTVYGAVRCIDEWVIAARTLRMAVRPYDGNKALYLTSEYHSLYDCLHCWRSTGTYRIRQHFKVHQGGIDERPFQLRE